MTRIVDLMGVGEDFLPEEPVSEVKGTDGEATLEGGATTIMRMVTRHPKDCTRGTEGAVVTTSILSSPYWLVGTLPNAAVPYAESLGWNSGALATAEGPIDIPVQGNFLMAYFLCSPWEAPFFFMASRSSQRKLFHACKMSKKISKICWKLYSKSNHLSCRWLSFL